MNQTNSWKVKSGWALALLAAFTLLSASTFWSVLSNPDAVLAFNDGNIEYSLMPAFQLPQAFLRLWDNQTFFGMGVERLGFNTYTVGDALFGPHEWRRLGQAFLLALCGLAFYWMFRQYRMNRFPSALAAGILILTGWCNTFALSGLPVRPSCLAFTALAIGFMERGRQTRGWIPYALAGGCLGLGISEVPDVGAFLALAAGFILFWTHVVPLDKSRLMAPRHLAGLSSRILLVVAFSALLGWQTILSIVGTQITGVKQGMEEQPEARYAWATQWSIPPAETWNIVSGSYFGMSMRSEQYPYWGRMGRSEGWETTRQGFRNFNMTGWHLGVVPCILLVALFIFMFRTRRTKEPETRNDPAENQAPSYSLDHPHAFSLMVFIGGALSLMLMWGKYFPLYHLFWSLPYMSAIRNPDKWNGPFTLFTILGIALMLDLVWRHFSEGSAQRASPSGVSRPPSALRAALLYSSIGMAAIALVIFLATSAGKTAFIAHLVQEGFEGAATIAYDNAIAACLKVLIISGVVAGLVAFLVKRETPDIKRENKEKAKTPDQVPGPSRLTAYILLGALAALSLGDLVMNNRSYVTEHQYKALLQPNPLTAFLDAHQTEGRVKLLPPQNGLLNNLRLTLLEIKGYDLFDPISISRMPLDYEALFKALEKNPLRLWELGSIRYFVTIPGVVDELNKLDRNRGRFAEKIALGIGNINGSYIPMETMDARQRYLRVVEFTGALPKYRLVGKVTAVPLTPEGEAMALAGISSPQFNPAQDAIIHTTNAIPSVNTPGNPSVKIQDESSVDTRLSVSLDQPGLLVRSTRYDVNWHARIDGQETPLYRVNSLFQGIFVPAGPHAIDFSYYPPLKSLRNELAGRGLLLVLLGVYGLGIAFRKSPSR